MKQSLLILLLTVFQFFSSQIVFQNYNYSFGPDPYNAPVTGNGTIYYTTDGTDPTLSSPSAENQVNINISQILTVKARLKIGTNQLSEVFSKKYYFGPFPIKEVYFKKPPTWNSACSFANSQDPVTTVDFFSGPPMTLACEGWFKATHDFFVGLITFDNCANIAPPPIYQSYSIVTEDIVFYDYSAGPITNPPACLLAVNDPSKKVALIKFYPNPVQDFLTIDSEIKFLSYEIVDFSGKSLQSNQLSGAKIDVSKLPNGSYLVKLNSTEKQTIIVKFIKK